MSHDLAGLRLALDLDNTLMRTTAAFAAYVEATLGRTVDPRPAVYDLADAGWFADREELLAAYRAAIAAGLYERTDPYPDAVETVARMASAGARIVVVTARVDLGQDATFDQLDRVGLVFHEIHFEAAKWTVPADVYVDDNPHVLAELDARGLLRIAADQPYNEALGGARFTSWPQVPALVRALVAEAAA